MKCVELGLRLGLTLAALCQTTSPPATLRANKQSCRLQSAMAGALFASGHRFHSCLPFLAIGLIFQPTGDFAASLEAPSHLAPGAGSWPNPFRKINHFLSPAAPAIQQTHSGRFLPSLPFPVSIVSEYSLFHFIGFAHSQRFLDACTSTARPTLSPETPVPAHPFCMALFHHCLFIFSTPNTGAACA